MSQIPAVSGGGPAAGSVMYIRTGAPMSDFYKSRLEQRQRLERERQEKEEHERQHRLRFRSFDALVKEIVDDGMKQQQICTQQSLTRFDLMVVLACYYAITMLILMQQHQPSIWTKSS
jgi:hypothetical protein